MAAKKEEFELITFYGNWADEMDIQSFNIKPKGYLKELISMSKLVFKSHKEIEIYVGTNEIIYFTEEDPENPYRDTLRSTLSATEIPEKDKNVIEKYFDISTSSFNIDVLEKIADILVDLLPKEDSDIKVFPLLLSHLSE